VAGRWSHRGWDRHLVHALHRHAGIPFAGGDLVRLAHRVAFTPGRDLRFPWILEVAARARVLILTIHDDEAYFFQALQAGAAGYVLKGASRNELLATIQHVIEEALLIPPTLAPHLLADYLGQVKADRIPSYGQLSPREREVVQFIARGRTNKEIAKRLSISVRTVERHRSSIMNKLGLQNRAELVAYAVQQGLSSGGEPK